MPTRIQYHSNLVLPEICVYIGRPSIYGNPFIIGKTIKQIKLNIDWKLLVNEQLGDKILNRNDVVILHNKYILFLKNHDYDLWKKIKSDLYGKDVACWCKINQKCHGDNLLRHVNGLF